MTQAEARTAVQATIAVLNRIAARTRTPADDLLIQILIGNEAKLATAVHELANDPVQPPPPERIAAALNSAGIRA